MAFWSTPLGNSDGSAADPKRKFRFTVEFPGLLGKTARVQALQGASAFEDGIVWCAKSVSKPAMTITEADHTFLDKKFYFPGRVEWSTVTLTLVDPADPTKTEDAVKQMNQIIEASGYHMFKSSEDLESMSKSKAASALGNVVNILCKVSPYGSLKVDSPEVFLPCWGALEPSYWKLFSKYPLLNLTR